MNHDSPSHRIFKITEMTRSIASQLIPIGGESAVNLACACRYLEEPVLSTLWETQRSFETLLEVLPKETWEYIHVGHCGRAVRDLARSRWRNQTLKFRVVLVQDYERSTARGLD